jgi:hypothetical protein
MRPNLEVLCAVRRCKSLGEGTLQVEVINSGRVAAHNVHGWIDLLSKLLPTYCNTIAPFIGICA